MRSFTVLSMYRMQQDAVVWTSRLRAASSTVEVSEYELMPAKYLLWPMVRQYTVSDGSTTRFSKSVR